MVTSGLTFARRLAEQLKQSRLGVLHCQRGLQVWLIFGSGQQICQGWGTLEDHQTCLVEQYQAPQGGLGVLVPVDLICLAFIADDLGGEQARTMHVEPLTEPFLPGRRH